MSPLDSPAAHPPRGQQAPASAAPRTLPLEATRTPDGQGWLIRLPVWAEQVTVTKEVIVGERVVVHRQTLAETARIQAEIRRERLRMETDGDAPVANREQERRV